MSGLVVSGRPRGLLPLIAALVFAALLSLSLQRTAFNYGNETDFLGGFVPEATRFLAGGPLAVDYHPPLYPIVLAVVYSGLGDWLRAGLVISLLSGFVALFASFRLFDLAHGRGAGVGAVVGLLLSLPFLTFSLLTTADAFFLALAISAPALFASAELRNRRRHWFWGGLVVGLATLTRTNGAVLLLLLLGAGRSKRRPGGALALAGAGVAVPLLLWLAVAVWTGSPLVPQSNYENLALTYYSAGDRTSGDAIAKATADMDSAWDVISRNPRRIARIYVRDLTSNVQRLFVPDLLPFPLAVLAFPGLCALVVVHVPRYGWVLPATLGAMFLLLNFKAWETRYYLLFVPFMGAGIGLAVAYLRSQAVRTNRRRALAAILGISLALATLQTGVSLRRGWWDLSMDAQDAARLLAAWGAPPGSVVIARKPHICFYSGLECGAFPNVARLEELRASIEESAQKWPRDAKVFLFFGFAEKALRPTLARPLHGWAQVPWLHRVGEGGERHMRWILFEIVRESLDSEETDTGQVDTAGQQAARRPEAAHAE
jgi:hypothetical protein